MNLRDYQNRTISKLRQQIISGVKKLIMCSPTGSGKTVMFSFMLKSAIGRGKKCMVLTHRTELLLQAGGILSGIGCEVVNLDAKMKTIKDSNLYVAMAQTLTRRLKNKNYQELIGRLDLIIIDESHLQSFNSIMPYINENTIIIGATATPLRTGNQISLNEFYQHIVEEVTISYLIENGFLAKPNYYGFKVDLKDIKIKGGDYDSESLGDFMSKNKIFDGVYENYTKITPNKKALIFSPNVASSKRLVSELQNKGLKIKHLDGETPEKERKEILQWFKNTPGSLLSNVGVLTAGYDEPSIEVVILYRATKSLSLYLQMVGRGSRVTETKNEFTILDFGNNIYTHDFWHIDREWSLQKAVKEKGLAPVKNCKNCNAIIPAQQKVCKYCGQKQPETEKEKKERLLIELQKITPNDVEKYIEIQNFEKLEAYADFKGYKKSWVSYRIPIEKLNAYAEYKNYNKMWVQLIKSRRNEK
jgi:superfamily II DNA or RNA helicase